MILSRQIMVEFFAHFSEVQTQEFKTLGQEIVFKISEGQKVPQAANVTAK